MKLAVSILSSNYSEEETIKKINETDAEYIHVDVMDGHFVANVTKEYEYLRTSSKPLDIHLMVSRPFEYISRFAELPLTESICIHVELEDNLDELLNYIRMRGLKCGLVISPSTAVEKLKPYLDHIDEVLIMLVEPGRGGQTLIEECLSKIDELSEIRELDGYNYRIVVDGGVNDKTISKVLNADIAVTGSYICKSKNFQEQIDRLRLSKR